jgi:glycosyltransferase involved in cell wall biosynthesis
MVLGLFFSRGVSLQLWVEKGLFDREKLLYEAHLNNGNCSKIYWFTYGVEDIDLSLELKKAKRLHSNIEVVAMPKIFNIPKVGSYVYSLLLPIVKQKLLKKCDIYKTNQTDGSWSAVLSKKLYKKKLLYRTGYTMSQLENKLKRFNRFTRKSIEFFEIFSYRNCNKAIVASNHNLRYVSEKYSINKNIEVIYNFINKKIFYNFEEEREKKVIFIGRLSDEKNIFNLITALDEVNLPLDIYGSGSLKKELQHFINENNFNVQLMGNVSNNELPSILNRSQYYTLVSKHEGMPKALIEGMACGCICIGTDVTGINEVIIENRNGILAKDTSSESIKIAFEKAINLSNHQKIQFKLSMKNHIDELFTLETVVKKEKEIFSKLGFK